MWMCSWDWLCGGGTESGRRFGLGRSRVGVGLGRKGPVEGGRGGDGEDVVLCGKVLKRFQ